MRPKKKRGDKVKHKSIHFQGRLHSANEYEGDAIDEYEWFSKKGFEDRQTLRELLLAHRELRKQGYEPAKVRKPQFVTLDMVDKLEQLSEMTELLINLVSAMADGSFVPPDSVRSHIEKVANRVGVDMSASSLAGAVIQVEIEDDEEW